MPPFAIVLGFLASATAVTLAGIRLARDGDVIAARTRLGGLWIGSIFVATVTSFPELTTDLSAVRLGVLDLAAGDLFGSSMANMLILALVSLVPGRDVFRRAAIDNALSASLAIGLNAIAAMAVLTRSQASVFGVGIGSLILAGGYLIGVRTIFRNSALARLALRVEEITPEAEAPPDDGPPLGRAIVGFVLASVIILVAAPLFAASAKALAAATGVSTTFIGTWLVGFATSLPELVTSLAAVRMQAYDLAVGNLFGSSAVNMTFFVALDLMHGRGPVLAAVSPVHALSGLIAVVLMSLGLAAVVYRAQRRYSALEPGAILMMLVYVAGLALILFQSERP